MNRRMVMTAAAMAALAGSALAQGHVHHDHGDANPLLDAASACTKAGLACIDHCLQAMVAGDMSLAACARSTDQMLSVCAALSKLASTKASYLPAKVALAVCEDCEKECRKHADKHATCKACAEACAECAKECRKVAA